MLPFFMKWLTHLIFRDCPIACLCIIYKILTECVANKINKYAAKVKIMADQQKGCMKGNLECEKQLIINTTLMKQADKYARNL